MVISGHTPLVGLERFSEKEREQIHRAFALASEAHRDQTRLSGEAYITHPLAVAQHVADWGLDATTIVASLLHDVIEDGGATNEQIKKQFGHDVAFLVDGVSKLKMIGAKGTTQENVDALQIESLKKMFFAMAKDIRVVLIKLADRYHNMTTLRFQNTDAQKRISLETFRIYAPIAGRLGMTALKGELEDLAFIYAYPDEYSRFEIKVEPNYLDKSSYIDRIRPMIAQRLRDAGMLDFTISARVKHRWSLHQKMTRLGTEDTEKIFDLVALRIIVPTLAACYEALGIIHAAYQPVAGRVKDYIAMPKPNGYQSLHTTIVGEKGRVLEVQIRTQDMHDHAENGIAAHWAYSESGKRLGNKATAHETQWVTQLKNALKSLQGSEDLKDMTSDFFHERIYVFTPLGEVKELPEGATPIDFAYAIHTSLGHMTNGAKVNDRIVPLSYALQNSDVVEIIKTKTSKPSFDWLNIVKTSHARQQINSWFKRHDPRTAIANGHALLQKALRPLDLSIEKLSREKIKDLCATHSVKTTDDLLTRISVGDLNADDVVKTAFRDQIPKKKKLNPKRTISKKKILPTADEQRPVLSIQGQQGILYKLGRCCNPSANEKVTGYLTRSRGVTIHTLDCSNVRDADQERILSVHWA